MSYIDIEKQLNQIFNDLQKKMRDEKIVDQKDKAVNIEEFDRLIDEAISKCFEMLKELELSRHYDANSNNIIFARIESLRAMKENGGLIVYVEKPFDEEIVKEDKKKEPKRWFAGITKLFKKKEPKQSEIPHER